VIATEGHEIEGRNWVKYIHEQDALASEGGSAGVWWRNMKETACLEDLSVDRNIILKWISKKWD
jgi:hypothetical protein